MGLVAQTPPSHEEKGLVAQTPPSHEEKGLVAQTPPSHEEKGLVAQTPPSHEEKGLVAQTPPSHEEKGLVAQTPPSHEEMGLVTVERFLGCAESAILILNNVIQVLTLANETDCHKGIIIQIKIADSAQPRKRSIVTGSFSS